jgi:hypothetical protein
MALIASVFCGACAPHATAVGITVVEAPSAPPQKEAAILKVPLSTEAEAKLKEFIGKTREATVKIWNDRMTKKIAEVATVTGLGDESKHALEVAAKQAVEAFADSWSGKMSDEVRMELNRRPQFAALMLDQRLAQVEAYVAPDWSSDVVRPFEQDAWLKALHQVLNSDQAAAWDKAQTERKDAIEKEVEGPLKANGDKVHEMQSKQMLSACREIELAAALPKERSDKLEELSKSVADQATELWRQRMIHILVGMDDDQRKSFTGQGGMFIGMDPKQSGLNQAAWKDGVVALLTADENKRLQATRDADKLKRAHALSQIMIALLDEKIAFTESQRAKLQPITARLVKNEPEICPDNSANIFGYYGYSTDMFYAMAGTSEADLKPILDEVQMKHWRKLAEPDDTGTGKVKSKPDPNAAPEDVDRAISSFLFEKEKTERKRLIEASGLKMEDAVRVAGLSADARARLELAVRGAAEQSLIGWRWFIEQQIRAQVQEATPQNIRQRLDNIQDYIFQQRIFFGGRGLAGSQADQGLWEKTVDVELDAKQKEAWKKETDARAAFRDGAIAEFVISEFDRRYQLTADQSAKLEPVIAGLVHDCSPDISRIFSSAANTPWFLEGPYSLLPFAGVPEADLKAILTKEQWDAWHDSPENANSTSLWQNIQMMQKQRGGKVGK